MSIETGQSGAPARNEWSSLQAYSLAVICLLVGIAIGYVYHVSGEPVQNTAVQAPGMPGQPANTPPGHPPPAQHDGMVPEEFNKLVSEYEAALQKNPSDVQALTSLGNLYYDAQQWLKAVETYDRVLKLEPANANVHTDRGTAYFYLGKTDEAIASFELALASEKSHPNALYNLGMVKWQGKGDAKGAVVAWERMLKTNPNFPNRAEVEELIERAKRHAKRG